MCNDKCGRCDDIGLANHGSLFGMKVIPREAGINPLIELYIEDDGIWHYKMSFDSAWLQDLLSTTQAVKDRTEYLQWRQK